MTVRCTKCGEELLGAVNRCWKCGQTFALHPEIDGRPPLRSQPPISAQPLEAVTVDQPAAMISAPVQFGAADPAAVTRETSPQPVAAPSAAPNHYLQPQAARMSSISTADRIDAQRKSLMAMGGTVGSLVLGLFSLLISPFRFEGAVIALLGLVMGIWGLYSPRRKLALAAMLICCLSIGLGAFTGVRQLHVFIMKSRPPVVPEDPALPPR